MDRVNGRLYSGGYYDTVEAAPMPGGGITPIKYLHLTDNGELLWGSGIGAREVPDDKNMARLNASGTAWTYAQTIAVGRQKMGGGRNVRCHE